MDEDILVRLLKQDSCPEALVDYGLKLGQRNNLSEGQAAVFLLASARRLDEKYPELRELGRLAPAIQPRFKAVYEQVEPNLANRKGSGLGRMPFLSKRFPMIVMEDGSNVFNTLEFSEAPYETIQEQKDTKAKLRAFIQELPESQREVLVMRHYMEMSFQDIAESTGVSINTALGRMRYALINLRKKMLQHNIAYDQNIYPK